MKLQTVIKIPPTKTPISYGSKLFLWGSCFSDHMAYKLTQGQFHTKANPFGIIFNPLALATIFERIERQQVFTTVDIFESQGLWHSYYFHSQCSNVSSELLLAAANKELIESFNFLKSSSHIIITLGTAWGYLLQNTTENKPLATEGSFWVANCHKQPAHFFKKQLATVQEIEAALRKIHEVVLALNPSTHIIFTLSPVRHLKDGMVENSRSKALLLSAIHNYLDWAVLLTNIKTRKGVSSYFPAYEIQMDELRDYRFYKADLLHPSTMAIQYIWERFIAYAMENNTIETLKEVEKLQLSLSHKPIHPEGAAHLAFKKNLNNQIKGLQAIYPWMFRESL